MKEGEGQRLVAGALLQELLSLEDLRVAMNRLPQGEPIASEVLLQGLVSDGLLEREALLGLESTHPGLLSGSAQATAAPAAGSQPLEPREGEVPKVLTALTLPAWRQYRSLRFLGEGGMGRIFKAFDASLRRMVALKFLRRTEPELIARFLMEAQHQAMVDHPNICRVYEVGEWQGLSYIAMQFIRGESLDVGGEALSLRHKVQVMAEVAEAVHAAHNKGLIHRDLKPANIMLEPRESGCPCPYVLDFGLARGVEETGFTVEGMLVGTFHFMSPEQARGDRKGLSRRSDIYSLGATLYALLSGHPPFWEYEGMAVVPRLLEEEPTPIGRLMPDLPGDLRTITHKCLQKEAELRYDSALALAEDLRRFLADEPIHARRPTLRYRARKFVARHRALVTVGVLAAALLVGLAGFSTWSWATARTRAAYAQRYGQEAERLEAQARYLHLLPVHDVRAGLGRLEQHLRSLQQQVALGGRLAKGPGEYALGRGAWALGDPDRALAHLETALQEGYDDPLVRQALGRVQLDFYRRALQESYGVADLELRALAQRRAQAQWREPARRNLGTAALEGLDGARLAFAEGRMEDALEATRRAMQLDPWRYEAAAMEATLLQAQAFRLPDPTEGCDLLRQAVTAWRRAARIAPSDPELALGEARAWRDLLRVGAGLPQGPEGAEAGFHSALEVAGRIYPAHPESPHLAATALTAAYVRGAIRGNPDQGLLNQAVALAQQGLDLAKHARRGQLTEARAALGEALYRRAHGCMEEPKALPDLDRARALVKEGLSEAPQDLALRRLGAGVETLAFILESRAGRAPWGAFEAALDHLRSALEQAPQQVGLIRALTNLWVERAEYEQTVGIDPRSSCQRVLEYAGQLNALSSEAGQGAQATVHMILGEWLLVQGLDPRKDFQKARMAFKHSLARMPGNDAMLFGLAATWLREAQWQCQQGEEALSPLREAEAVLKMGRGRPAWVLLETRWALLRSQGGREEGSLPRLLARLQGSPYGKLKDGRVLLAEAALLNPALISVEAGRKALEGLPADAYVQNLRMRLEKGTRPQRPRSRQRMG